MHFFSREIEMYKSPSVSIKSAHCDVSHFLRLHRHDWLRGWGVTLNQSSFALLFSWWRFYHILPALTRRTPEGPLYLFWKRFHAKVIGLFTHHEKCRKRLHVHRKRQAITFHLKKCYGEIMFHKIIQILFTFRKTYKYDHYKNVLKHFTWHYWNVLQ